MTSKNIYIEKIKEISHENKYTKWYVNIISNAISRASTKPQAIKILGYSECHHIVPEALFINRVRKGPDGFVKGDSSDLDNLVHLSAREHFIVHVLLPMMIKDKTYIYKVSSALAKMGKYENKYFNSRLFEIARKYMSEYSHNKTTESKERVSNQMLTYYQSEEGIEFLLNKAETQKNTMIGSGNPAFGKDSGFLGGHHTEEHLNKMRNNTGESNHRTGIAGYTKKFKIIHQDGSIQIERNLTQFCLDNNIKLSNVYWNMTRKLQILYNNELVYFEVIQDPKAILIDPIGLEHELYNIKEFCKNNNLYYQCIIHVLGGTKPQHKGWTGYKINRD
jgi:hypothetical protein